MSIFKNVQCLINNSIISTCLFLFNTWNLFLVKTNFLPKYFKRNENIWNDGFLFDFLQKKTIDAWIRQYIIYTGFLFSERIVFESITRLYNDLLVWPYHNISIFESDNTTSMINTVIFIYFSLFILLVIFITILL